MTPPWRSLDDLRVAVREYGTCWWQSDPHVLEAMGRDPGLDARLAGLDPVRTVDVFRTNRVYTPERQLVHAGIAERQLGAGPKPATPTVYFTTGCMGAGKTKILRRFVEQRHYLDAKGDPSTLSQIAADEVRAVLPGYGHGDRLGLGSVVVHRECFDVTYGAVYRTVADAGYDIVYDTIGRIEDDGTASFEPQLRDLKDRGYRVELLRAEAPLELCVRRAEARALETGRLVDANDQRDAYDGPAAVERRLRAENLLDGVLVVDTSSEGGTAPIIEATDEWRDRHAELEALVFS